MDIKFNTEGLKKYMEAFICTATCEVYSLYQWPCKGRPLMRGPFMRVT